MGDGDTYYLGEFYRTEYEARWAVFLHTHDEAWNYEPDGHPQATSPSYCPQFFLPARGVYLEVRDHWDRHARQPYLRHHSEAPEPCIFLAVGSPPTDQQMRAVGWWDSEGRQGVLQLTVGGKGENGTEWELLFPPANDAVLAALEAAQHATFDMIPMVRQDGEAVREVRDVKPERESEDGR